MKICVVGLGYVGYPLFELFSEKYDTYGIDVPSRVKELNNPKIVSHYTVIEECDFIFVCVPTPVDEKNEPDYTILHSVSMAISQYLRNDQIVVYESTVGPDAVKMHCLSSLRYHNHLIDNKDFFVVYSPERVSPGVTGMELKNLTKLVACPDEVARKKTEKLYQSVGINTYPCNDYRIAEMSKLLENIQRDVNIALMNEFAWICSHFRGLKFMDVLNAAKTKKDFIPYTMGMVGGHCIPVDPYFLIKHYNVKDGGAPLINMARLCNKSMVDNLAQDISTKFKKYKHICILGASYKENVDDLRNSGSLKLYKKLVAILPDDCYISLHDPFIEKYSYLPVDADCYVLAVPHVWYNDSSFYLDKPLYDVKGAWFGRKHLFKEYHSYGEGEKQKKDK